MSNKPFATSIAALLIIALIAPATFFIVPQRASAAEGAVTCTGGLLGSLFSIGGGSVSALTSVPTDSKVANFTEGSILGTTAGQCIYQLIIVPLARSMIRNILQSITSSIINWITGRNGTGQPSFVQNLSRHLQSVGDAVALPFIN